MSRLFLAKVVRWNFLLKAAAQWTSVVRVASLIWVAKASQWTSILRAVNQIWVAKEAIWTSVGKVSPTRAANSGRWTSVVKEARSKVSFGIIPALTTRVAKVVGSI